jgi:hypothetical protein
MPIKPFSAPDRETAASAVATLIKLDKAKSVDAKEQPNGTWLILADLPPPPPGSNG